MASLRKYLKFEDGPKFGPCDCIRIVNGEVAEAVIKGVKFSFHFRNGKVMIGKLCFDEVYVVME